MNNDEMNGAEFSSKNAPSIGSANGINTDAVNLKNTGGTNGRLFFSKLLAGFVIGAGAIMPGLSGGILAVSMGLYQPAVEAIVGFFKAPGKNFKFLFPLGLGGVTGLVLFMFLIEKLFSNYQTAIICLFMGLVLGAVPSFIKEANDGKPFKKTSLLFAAIGFLFAFALLLLGFFTGNQGITVSAAEPSRFGSAVYGVKQALETANTTAVEVTPLLSVICGGIVIFGVVFPGISTSFILMNMGVYENFLGVFTGLLKDFSHNIVLVLCALLGMLIVIVPMLLIVRKVLNKFHRQSYYVLFGVLISTVVGCIMQEVQRNISGISPVRVIVYIVLFAAGTAASYFMDKAMKKLELKNEEGRASESE